MPSNNLLDPQSANTLLCVDCVEGMQRLPDCCIPLSVTSPPFDNLRQYSGHPFDFRPIAQELFRVTQVGGVVCWVTAEQTNGEQSGSASEQRLFLRAIGFRLHDRIFFEGAGCRHYRSNGYANTVQEIFVLAKGKPAYVNQLRDRPNASAGTAARHSSRNADGTTQFTTSFDKVVPPFGPRTNVWRYPVGFGTTSTDKFAYEHPALMPERLAEDLIIGYSRPGDLVFDPMSGAATTAKMSLLNYRQFLGLEIHEPYHRLGLHRIAVAREELRRRFREEFGVVLPRHERPNGHIGEMNVLAHPPQSKGDEADNATNSITPPADVSCKEQWEKSQ